MSHPPRLYRLLLKLYPARFREEYETPLERQFVDEYRDLPTHSARARFWMAAIADLAASIPPELLREFGQDVRYAARVYRRRSLVTALTLAALALAIGATTGVFSVVNALLLRSLPFRDPARLVQAAPSLYGAIQGSRAFQNWAGAAPYLQEATLFAPLDVNLVQSGAAIRVNIAETSANFFSVLGTEPVVGRAFEQGEETAGQNSVAVIGYGLWQQSFGGNPNVLGATIRLNGVPFTVLGVAPPGMDFPKRTSVWTPTVFDLRKIPKSDAVFWRTIGRLKRGVTIQQADQQYAAEWERVNPKGFKSYQSMNPDAMRWRLIRDELAGPVRQASLILMGVVVFVLLIACSNVAHLLLSRITERRPELVVRFALGASRGRLLQQLITECTLLTVTAAALGMAVAQWAVRLASSAQPVPLATQEYSVLDWRVLAFAAAIAVLTGLIFGVLPATLIARIQPSGDLMRLQPGKGASHLRTALIGLQAVLTVILVAGAATLSRSFVKLMSSDLGFRTDRVITASVSLPGSRSAIENRRRQYYTDVLARLRSIPGVESAGAVEYLPLDIHFYGVLGFRLDSDPELHRAIWNHASPGYFRTLGTPLLEGRDFSDEDRLGHEPVVLVNDAFAREAGGKVLGHKLLSGKSQYTIIGVVRTALFRPGGILGEQVYSPTDQVAPEFATFVAKVRGNPAQYLPLLRDTVQGVDSEAGVYGVETLEAKLDRVVNRPRFYTEAMLFFAGFALLLAVVGIHGVASHSVERRTHEIGIRLAVGASPEGLRSLMLRQSLIPVMIGVVVGIAGALALGKVVHHLLFDFDKDSIAVGLPGCAAAATLLASSAAAAVWAATHRILRLDPMRVLRSE